MMAGNKAVSAIGNAYGGAIYNGKIGQITGDFLNNYAQTASETNKAYGGAVYAAANMNFVSGADVHFMSGNYTKDPTRGKTIMHCMSQVTIQPSLLILPAAAPG